MDIDVLRSKLKYDPVTGEFFAVSASHGGRWKEGRPIGGRQANGYLAARVAGRLVLLHRAAFALMTGRWPTQHIDHRNGDRTDNRWENLREVSPLQNQWNRMARYGGTHISHNGTKPFRAQIRNNGRRVHLGYFATKEEAEAAYERAAEAFRSGLFPDDATSRRPGTPRSRGGSAS